ncbi:uncharacterized protein At2g39795, mitochondrial-like [Phalaenopsis equestris]|uniref:uncharacterized protein At2g39795, mitochondrial-like n=1 Tax=Phalaenopsis equestris TaxID=78828 RepID=UPI0009E3D1AF|nr:uncharacterized protein At2g39795, mitochondrial-like [Phalaenopsis equestris]
MASSIASSLLRRTARLPISSAIFVRRPPALLYCSTVSSSPSPLLTRKFLISSRTIRKLPALFSLRFASTKVDADENLDKVLQSEIECAQETEENGREIDAPKDFPFEIIDNSGDQTIILKREFAGENIQATVYMNFDGEEMSKDDDDASEVDQDSAVSPNISLLVTIDKGEGPVLEIGCNINSSDLEIESMTMKSSHDSDGQGAYQGPDFSELDESLQKAFHKYLKLRGFDSSLRDFLHEYMMHKDEREYLTWLENVKEFVGKLQT